MKTKGFEMNRIFLNTIATLLVLIAASLQVQAQQEFTYKVRQERLLGDRQGQLIISPDRIEFRTEKPEESRSWAYPDIRLVEVLSPTVIRIWPYENEKWIPVRERDFTFRIVESTITAEVSDFLRHRVKRPFVTSFADTGGEPVAQVPVNHRLRFRGHAGVLKVYNDRLVFEAADGKGSRTWRWNDIRSIAHPDRYRLDVLTYEPQAGGPDRSFNFELKESISDRVYDYLWDRVNQPAPFYRNGEPDRGSNLSVKK